MNLLPNKRDAYPKPITDTRISASEWNQLVGSCMAFITEAGFTPDASDNEQFLNAFKAIAASLELIGANTNLSNLTATGEAKFDAKVNLDGSNATFPHIVETYHSGTSWYRLWSDGWCEQGDYYSTGIAQGQGTATITLLKPLQLNNGVYDLQVTKISSSTANTYGHTANINSETQFTINNNGGIAATYIWRASGYLYIS